MLCSIKAFAKKGLATLAVLSSSLFDQTDFSDCSEDLDHVPPPRFKWSHNGGLSSFDHASIRRGFQVYREVCASCHSINQMSFRNFVGVTHDESSMAKLASTYDIIDGPNDEGEMFERPGKLSDRIPGPYKNEEEGRFANNGSLPPDLSLIVKARHHGEDYIFALLTGYTDPPAGINILPNSYYNPYFLNGIIAMIKPISNGQIEYEDGTPCSEAQMAKDVATFLAWTAEPEHDMRKKNGIQWIVALITATLITGYYKRFRWAPLKSRKISYEK